MAEINQIGDKKMEVVSLNIKQYKFKVGSYDPNNLNNEFVIEVNRIDGIRKTFKDNKLIWEVLYDDGRSRYISQDTYYALYSELKEYWKCIIEVKGDEE